MFKLPITKLLALTSCFVLTACTETIYKEVTPESDTDATVTTGDMTSNDSASTLGVGANMVAISDSSTSGNTTTSANAGTANNTPATASSLPTSTVLLEDPTSETTIGTPGSSVDCMNLLPCRWVSEDAQFALTVTSADNIATRDRLSLSYYITTTHDATAVVSNAGSATDSEGLVLRPEDQTLGEGNGGLPQGVLAGDRLVGMINFNDSASGDTLTTWSISILDTGVARSAMFTNLPRGSLTTAQADCQYTLPCIWTTPGNDVAVTLQSVGGISTNNRVNVSFSVETSSDMTFAVDAGSYGAGSDGTQFEGRTLGLGTITDYKKLTATLMARSPYFGSVHFYRTQTIPTHLNRLMLVLYEDAPVPRWNPEFVNVPIQ